MQIVSNSSSYPPWESSWSTRATLHSTGFTSQTGLVISMQKNGSGSPLEAGVARNA